MKKLEILYQTNKARLIPYKYFLMWYSNRFLVALTVSEIRVGQKWPIPN